MNSNTLSSIVVTYVSTIVPVTVIFSVKGAQRDDVSQTLIGRGIVRKKGRASKEVHPTDSSPLGTVPMGTGDGQRSLYNHSREPEPRNSNRLYIRTQSPES